MLDEDEVNVLQDMAFDIMKKSSDFKDMDEDIVKQFVTANFIPIMNKMLEINDMGAGNISADREAVKKAEAIKKLKEKYGNGNPNRTAETKDTGV
jgi:imidazole glycerol phosphate synthase subunit HisF